MKQFFFYQILILAFTFCSSKNSQAQETTSFQKEVSTLRNSFTDDYFKVYRQGANVKSCLSLLKYDGSFSDSEPKMFHLYERIMCMTIAYENGLPKYRHNEYLRFKIYKALSFWLNNKPKYEFPKMPFTVLRACAAINLALYDDMQADKLKSDSLNQICTKLQDDIIKFSKWCWYNGKSPKKFNKDRGHNRGGNVGYRLWAMHAIASCSNKVEELDWLSEIVKEQIPDVVNTENDLPTGKTPDGSWIQHNGKGAQHYWIGYGINWVKELTEYAIRTQKTKWKLTDTEYNQIANYYIDGFQWCYYKNRGAVNLAGRHNSLKQVPVDRSYIYNNIKYTINNLDFNFARIKELKEVLARNKNCLTSALDSNKYFWNTDLLIHGTKSCNYVIKMVSNRTKGCETSEGTRAHGMNNFLSGDGSTMILRKGKEYDKVRVVWNWRAVPGITALQKTEKLPLSPWGRRNRSKNRYAGGLTHNKSAIASFEYNRNDSIVNVKATKTYVTDKNSMFCLGNSINKKTDDNSEIWTTINQTERGGKVKYRFNKGRVRTIKEDKNEQVDIPLLTKLSWVNHDKITYILFPQDKTSGVKLFAEQRDGDWSNLDGRYLNEKAEKTNKVKINTFQLSINHGVNNKSSAYAYMVIANTSLKQTRKLFRHNNLKLISNNSIAQAVYNKEDKISLIAFHKIGKLVINDDLSIHSNGAIMISIEETPNHMNITISDPLQKRKRFYLKVRYKGKNYTIKDRFPEYPYVGKQINFNVNFK